MVLTTKKKKKKWSVLKSNIRKESANKTIQGPGAGWEKA